MNRTTPLLVLGLGNVLLEDDGVGSAAVALLLDRYACRRTVTQVLDGGTLGLSLLPYLEDADDGDPRGRHQGRWTAGRRSSGSTATRSLPRSPPACRRIRSASLICSMGRAGATAIRNA